jgi:hypothetical protein
MSNTRLDSEYEEELVLENASASDLLKLRGLVTASYQIGGGEECRVWRIKSLLVASERFGVISLF